MKQFTDDQLLEELRLRKRIQSVETEIDIPTRYLNDFPLGYVPLKIMQRMAETLAVFVLDDKIKLDQERKPNFTKFHAKMWVVVNK